MLRLRSSGARTFDWFCMRGRSEEERAMSILGDPSAPAAGVPNKDITAILDRHKALILWFAQAAGWPLLKRQRPGWKAGPQFESRNLKGLFLFFRLFFGRSKPFETLEQL